MQIHWLEFKQLDKATNHPSKTQMIRELSKLGHQVRYFCGYRQHRPNFGLRSDVITYYGMPKIPKLNSLFLLSALVGQIFQSLTRSVPDIVMIDYFLNLAAFPLLVLLRVLRRRPRIVLDVRTIPVVIHSFQRRHAIFMLSLRLARWSCDGITFITPFMRNVYLDRIHFDRRYTTFWTSGVDPDLFDPDRYPIEKKNDFVLFYHGGISLGRGVGTLIRATGMLRRQGYPVRLELIGNVVDREEIESLIQSVGGPAVCHLRKPVPHEKIPALIKAIDLPVIPLPNFIGWRVSSPIKLMEYMAMEKCMVLTDIEAHRQVAEDSPWAFYASADNRPEGLAHAILTVYKQRARLENLGRLARVLVRHKYTWQAQANKLVDFFESFK